MDLSPAPNYHLTVQVQTRYLKALLMLLALALIPVSAFSAQKITPGSICKVLNQKVVYENKTYTCVRSGKNLAWNKGVGLVKPSPTPSPVPTVTVTATPSPAPTVTVTATPSPAPTVTVTATPSPAPTVTVTATPSPAPTVTATPKATWANDYSKLNFKNFESNGDFAITRVWNALAKMKIGIPPKNTERTILVGPDSNPGSSYDFNTILDNYEAFFSWADIPTKYSLMYFRCDDKKNDLAWAREEFNRLYGYRDTFMDTFLVLNPAGTPRCGFGYAFSPNSASHHIVLAGWVLPGVVSTNSFDPPDYIFGHEFTHIIQANQRKSEARYSVPTWLIEGGATFFGLGASASTYDEYRTSRQGQADNPHFTYGSVMNIKISDPRNARKSFVLSEQEIRDWLLDNKSAAHSAAYREWNYSLGSVANEALAAVYGPESLMRLIGNVKVYGLEEGFKATYNVGFDSILPSLVKAIRVLLYTY